MTHDVEYVLHTDELPGTVRSIQRGWQVSLQSCGVIVSGDNSSTLQTAHFELSFTVRVVLPPGLPWSRLLVQR